MRQLKLFNKLRAPYYIVTPPYTYNSSGVRALHLLAHALNISGERSYVVLQHKTQTPLTSPSLITPVLTPEIIKLYADKNIEPIVIYPDKIVNNPLNARKIIRYLLAPAGAYGGPTDFPGEDVWSYLPGIAETQGNDQILRIPVTDTNIYNTPKVGSGSERKGYCFYSYKYDLIHAMQGNKLLPITDGMRRIWNMPPEEVAELLRASEACYTYENSQIIQEAQLCGCPVVLIRTPYFNEYLGKAGHIPYGVRWHDEENYIEKSPHPAWHLEVLRDYKKIEDEFWVQLDRFIKQTQAM